MLLECSPLFSFLFFSQDSPLWPVVVSRPPQLPHPLCCQWENIKKKSPFQCTPASTLSPQFNRKLVGPVTENMLLALKKSYDATPKPSFIIACGSCAISGGIYASSPQAHCGLEDILKPDMYVPGCPPHPAVLLDALVKMMKKRKI